MSAATYTTEALYTGGELIAQAPVSSKVVVVPVRRNPPSDGRPYYPSKTSSPSAIFRGQMLFCDLTETFSDDAGVGTEGCFSSFSNRALPEKGKEDEWCERYGFRGVAKNNMTDPQGGFMGWQSNYRGGNRTVANLLAGGTTIPYTGNEKVRIGTPIMWTPPAVKASAEYGRYEQPVAGMAPLDWSLMTTSLVPNVHVAMLDKQQKKLEASRSMGWNHIPSSDRGNGEESGKWDKVAEAKGKAIMLNAVAAIYILAGRGMVEVISPARSLERATERMHSKKIEKAIEDGVSQEDLKKLVAEKKAALEQAREEGDREAKQSTMFSPGFRENLDGDAEEEYGFESSDFKIYDRDVEWEKAWENARTDDPWAASQLLEETKFFEDLQWLAKGLAVGSEGRSRGKTFDAAQLDIMRLVSMGCLDGSHYNHYFNKVTDTILRQEKKTMRSFKEELKNSLGEAEMASAALMEVLKSRVIGTAIGSVSKPSGTARSGQMSSSQIDILLATPVG